MRLKALYSRDSSKRYRASLRFEKEHPGYTEVWPRGCWGAANGWLLMVGPSPGKSNSGNRSEIGGEDRPHDSQARIGPRAGVIDFKSGKNRNGRWNKLTSSILGSQQLADALTTVANLDWGNFPNHKKIKDADLIAGCPVVYSIMKTAHPRVVVSLAKVVWNHLGQYLGFCTIEEFQRNGLECRVFQIPNCRFESLLVKAPQHPSRFLSDRHCRDIATVVKWFVGE